MQYNRVKLLALATIFVACRTVFELYASEFAQTLPDFELKDGQDKLHKSSEIAAHGLVLVVTAPTWGNRHYQKDWCTHLRAEKPDSAAGFAFLQDMSQALLKSITLGQLRDNYKAGEIPTLLIDSDGKTRKALNVEKGKTVVLVYDREGKLILSEKRKPSKELAQSIWASLNVEQAKNADPAPKAETSSPDEPANKPVEASPKE